MAEINATDLTPETSATLDGSEQFVMFDSTEGKRGTVDVVGGYITKKTNAALASDYDSTATYAVGDYCIYNGTLYRCTTAITTAEAWTAGHWTSAALGDDVTDLKSALTKNAFPQGVDQSLWEQGWITNTGTNSPSGAAIRTITYVADNFAEFVLADTHRMVVHVYNASGTYLGGYNGTAISTSLAYITGKFYYSDIAKLAPNCKIRIVVQRKAGGGNATPASDYDKCLFIYSDIRTAINGLSNFDRAILKTAYKNGYITSTANMVAPYNDLNTFPSNEFCLYQNCSPANLPSDVDVTKGFSVLSYNPLSSGTAGTVQLLFNNSGNFYGRICWSNGWGNWLTLNDLYADRQKLLSKVVPYINSAERMVAPYDDLNTFPNNEYCLYQGVTPANAPSNVDFSTGVTMISLNPTTYQYAGQVQLLFNNSGDYYARICWSNGWNAWRQISNRTESISNTHTLVPHPLGITSSSRWIFCGDSITQGYTGADQPPAEKNWVLRLMERLGCINYTNRAVGGALYTQGIQYTDQNVDKAVINQLNQGLNADFLVVAVGTNDFGELAPTTDFLTDLEYTFNYIDSNFSGTVIIVTPIRRTNHINDGLKPLEWYAERIFEAACTHGYYVVNGFDFGFPSVTGAYQTNIMPDGLHPSSAGYKLYANAISTHIY